MTWWAFRRSIAQCNWRMQWNWFASKTAGRRANWRKKSALSRRQFPISKTILTIPRSRHFLRFYSRLNSQWRYATQKTAIDKIYPRHFLATAKVLKFPEVQMHEILSDFARMIPAALDNVKTSLPTDFPENVVTAVETNVLRLHGRLSREYGIK